MTQLDVKEYEDAEFNAFLNSELIGGTRVETNH